MIRWPGHIKAGSVSNDIFSGLDWFPTLLAAAGDPNIKEQLLKGTTVGGKTFKVHLDGYNKLPYLTGQQSESARHEFFYFDDDGALVRRASTIGNLSGASNVRREASPCGPIRSPVCV